MPWSRRFSTRKPPSVTTENAAALASRSILLLAGWHDPTAPLETVVLPFYGALKRQPESDATIMAYPDGQLLSSIAGGDRVRYPGLAGAPVSALARGQRPVVPIPGAETDPARRSNRHRRSR